MQVPKEKIIKEVQDRLDVCRLIADTISAMRDICGDKSPLTLHLDPHKDLLAIMIFRSFHTYVILARFRCLWLLEDVKQIEIFKNLRH